MSVLTSGRPQCSISRRNSHPGGKTKIFWRERLTHRSAFNVYVVFIGVKEFDLKVQYGQIMSKIILRLSMHTGTSECTHVPISSSVTHYHSVLRLSLPQYRPAKHSFQRSKFLFLLPFSVLVFPFWDCHLSVSLMSHPLMLLFF